MASGTSKWQSALSFSDRLNFIQAISDGILRSKFVSQADAQQEAKNVEAKLYESSVDRKTYEQGCVGYSKRSSTSGPITQAPLEESESDDGHSDVTTIGRYKDARHHKDGLFSSIFKARVLEESHKDDGGVGETDYVALKVTTPSQMSPPHDSAREARILHSIKNQHILPLLESFQLPGGRLVLVFPFVRYDLETVLRKNVLTHDQTESHMREMMCGLEFLHANGIIHRDIKPSNILLKSRTGPAYLTDFGIAWSPTVAASEDQDRKITDVGTTSYRPPELLFGNTKYGCSLDLWAAGCVVAEASSLSNEPLFDAGDLGSELALIRSIFQTLGTPDLAIWPEAQNFPDWGKMEFHHYAPQPWEQVLPNASPEARELVGALVKYESGQRLSAANALQHPYLRLRP